MMYRENGEGGGFLWIPADFIKFKQIFLLGYDPSGLMFDQVNKITLVFTFQFTI